MRLTISTGNYMNELIDWIKHYDYNHCVEKFEIEEDNCFVTMNAPESFAYDIINLFESIMFEQNQVAKGHARLREVLSDIVFEPEKREIAQLVCDYISECEYINLEGFVAFRMGAYAHKVDLVLYAAIRNALM